jgi:hypothetical protein
MFEIEVRVLTDEERSDVFRTRSLFTEETNILHELKQELGDSRTSKLSLQ